MKYVMGLTRQMWMSELRVSIELSLAVLPAGVPTIWVMLGCDMMRQCCGNGTRHGRH
jgi:hypothetical protein